MPTTPVTTPSGEVIQVNHPEGASQESIIRFAAASVGVTPSSPQQIRPQNVQDRMDDISAFDRFLYEFNVSPNLTGNLAVLAEAALPLGYFGDPSGQGNGLYTSPSEAYGEDYDELSFDERRQRIQAFKDQVRENQFPLLSKLEQEGADTGQQHHEHGDGQQVGRAKHFAGPGKRVTPQWP